IYLGEQWYSNKELFEQILEMKEGLQKLSEEPNRTSETIKKHNGLREELGELKKGVAEIKRWEIEQCAKELERNSVGRAVRDWGGWIIALIMFILNLTKMLSGG